MLHERFREQRSLLGLTQQVVADIVSVSKRTVIDWEKGISSPTAVQLSSLAQKGFDVAYIVTGCLPIAPIVYPTGGLNSNLVASQTYLSNREAALLDDFRSLSDVEKDAAETMLHAVAKSKKMKKA